MQQFFSEAKCFNRTKAKRSKDFTISHCKMDIIQLDRNSSSQRDQSLVIFFNYNQTEG